MIIHQAGPMNFLRTLLIILLVYYAVKFVVKLFGPYLLKKAVDKVQKKAQREFGNKQDTTVEEGKTVIDKKPGNAKNSNKDVGEYVDFEEID
ncbi:protein of unknown function [Tenacibaculum sp. MAR_2009_124]|uniref:DUF4834 family protein n=1 Tax=Tenacibaculum sp. MAR_2009_124 TaxID=1250059 RepID=UPI00089649B4|nr:DUF4834 family protein [Tenacibaculum sp. MAR_2009_124]SEC89807.1 protein of unknown function [Tenacibaculum sp. MAR_2009_124]